MINKIRYRIYGDTFIIKNQLKYVGCSWDDDRKCWLTPPLLFNSLKYLEIDVLAKSVGGDLLPEM